MAFGKMRYNFRNLTYIHRSKCAIKHFKPLTFIEPVWDDRSSMVSDFFSDKLKIRKALGRSGNLRKGKKITEFHPPHFTTFKTKLPLSVYLLCEVCVSSVLLRDGSETVGSSRLWWTPQLMLEQMGCEIVKLKTVRVPRHPFHGHTWRVYNLECVNKLASQGCQLSHCTAGPTQAPAAYNTPVPSERLRLPFLLSACRPDSLSADQETDPKQKARTHLVQRKKETIMPHTHCTSLRKLVRTSLVLLRGSSSVCTPKLFQTDQGCVWAEVTCQ